MACKRVAAGKRGGYRLLNIYESLGLLNKYCFFTLPDGDKALFPLTWPGLERDDLLENYETDALQAVVEFMQNTECNYALIDCGADIGIYSRLLLSNTEKIRYIVAFEPNPEAFYLLEENLRNTGIDIQLFESAVGSSRGKGELFFPEDDPISHAGFIRREQGGVIDIVPIDDLGVPAELGLMLKLDVEGAEYDALLGAARTLSDAPHFVVQFEAHREVVKRTGQEPVDGVKLLKQIAGDVTWIACNEEEGKVYTELNLHQPLFDQLPSGEVYDLVVTRVNSM